MDSITENALFCDYYAQWVQVYKEGAIRDVTMGKYRFDPFMAQTVDPLIKDQRS